MPLASTIKRAHRRPRHARNQAEPCTGDAARLPDMPGCTGKAKGGGVAGASPVVARV